MPPRKKPAGTSSDKAQPSWGKGWRVGLRLWIERADRAILGRGRLELLEGIDRQRSISAAARQMGMSYRRAWELVQSINEAAGEPLVIAATGGAHGGGAQLTPLGRWAVRIFRQLQDQVHKSAAGHLPRLFQQASSASLHVAAAMSLEEVLERILTDFALQEPALKVRAIFGASDELANHVLGGAPADLFLTADPRELDRLRAARLVRAGEQIALAENGLAAISHAEAGLAVRKPADIVRQRNLRIVLAAPGCPLGSYTQDYFRSLQIEPAALPRILWVENSRAVVTAVRSRQADAGLVYSSDAALAEECRTLFRVPRPPTPIRFAGAILHRGQDPGLARKLMDFLTSAPAGRRFRECGFQPVKRGSRALSRRRRSPTGDR
jgi:molybdenum ABC transporter molybdate-binding protein